MTIIGGADGPTSVFLSSNMGWINTSGLVIVILMLLPNILYAFRFKNAVNRCKSCFLNIGEQLGRYGCMLLMVFNIGLLEFGFASVAAFIAYLAGNALLMLLYWVFWAFYFKKQSLFVSMALAIIPTMIFLLSGITLRYVPLVVFAVVFGIFHIRVSYINAKGDV